MDQVWSWRRQRQITFLRSVCSTDPAYSVVRAPWPLAKSNPPFHKTYFQQSLAYTAKAQGSPRHRTFQKWNVKPHTLRSFLVPTRKSSTLDGSFSFMASSSHCLMEWRGKGGRRRTGQVHDSCSTTHEKKCRKWTAEAGNKKTSWLTWHEPKMTHPSSQTQLW